MTTEADIDITRGSPADLDELLPLFSAYRGFYSEIGDADAELTFLRDRMEREESAVFIARVGGEAAGFVQLYPTFSSVAICRKWVLNDLYVDERFRRQHVALALMQRSVEFVRESGAGRLDLKTGKENVAAQQLYEALGWERDTKFYTYQFPFD